MLAMESMSAYELERLANIKRNAALLESLGVKKNVKRQKTTSAHTYTSNSKAAGRKDKVERCAAFT